jgi:hypothetical protein
MKSASYVGEKKFSTRVYDKRNEFSLPIVKFPSFLFFFFFCGDVPFPDHMVFTFTVGSFGTYL